MTDVWGVSAALRDPTSDKWEKMMMVIVMNLYKLFTYLKECSKIITVHPFSLRGCLTSKVSTGIINRTRMCCTSVTSGLIWELDEKHSKSKRKKNGVERKMKMQDRTWVLNENLGMEM